MDDILKYPTFNILKNYIVNDPICDWFELNNQTYEKDKITHYVTFIKREASIYKNKILRKIKELSQINVPLNPTFNQTKELIYNNSQLILQGVLLNKNNIYVSCDIIITYGLFKKLFPKISNIPLHLYCKTDTDYLLIDLCYNTFHFKIDLKEIQNESYIFYRKCHIYAFYEVFYELTDNKAIPLLMGKEYYYKNTLLPKKEFIAKVTVDEKIKRIYKNSIKWITYLKKNHNLLHILPKPNSYELYPNMNYTNTEWENEKMKLATTIKEITLVWNISYEERCNCLEKGIECWDDPLLLKELKESKKKSIQERMIHMNQQNDVLIYPRKNISQSLKNSLQKTNADIYFDIESFLSFDEKQNLFTNVVKQEEPVIGIIGFIHNETFYDITINDFTKKDEERMIKQFSSYLSKISARKIVNIYHWGNAENNYFKYIHKEYPTIYFPKYNLINVLDHFRMEPIIVQGVFKFGLKSIGKALYNHNLIKTTWDENDSGLDVMIQFKELCKTKNKNIPLKRCLKIKEIINYNQVDCRVLYEIVELLREKY